MRVHGKTVVVLDNETFTKDKIYHRVVKFFVDQDIWRPGEIHSEKAEQIRSNAPQLCAELLDILKPGIYEENQHRSK